MSPAFGIDHYRIFEFNHIKDTLATASYLFVAAGSKEKFNNILNGFYKLKQDIEEKKYTDLYFDWTIFHGTHNSYLKKNMSHILTRNILGL